MTRKIFEQILEVEEEIKLDFENSNSTFSKEIEELKNTLTLKYKENIKEYDKQKKIELDNLKKEYEQSLIYLLENAKKDSENLEKKISLKIDDIVGELKTLIMKG